MKHDDNAPNRITNTDINLIPLLSICIPTYNRAQYLRNSIDSIICQNEFIDGRVEIVVSDNCSTDNTSEVCEGYVNQFSNFHYFRNAMNIRDRNFPIVLSKACGRLRRLSNDTIIYDAHSLSDICDLVLQYQEDDAVIVFGNGNFKQRNIVEIVDFRGFFHIANFRITYIGSFSIWDSMCESIDSDVDGCDLLLWQERKVLEMASKKNKIVLYNKMLFHSQEVIGKNLKYGIVKVFYDNFLLLIKPYLESGKLNEDDIKYVKRVLLFKYLLLISLDYEYYNHGNNQYADTEDINLEIKKRYCKEPYWPRYIIVRKIRYFAHKIKCRFEGFLMFCSV